MSFSAAVSCVKSKCDEMFFPYSIKKYKKTDKASVNKKSVTLQVRILIKSGYFSLNSCSKKAFPSALFFSGEKWLTASMTLEAAMVLSLFIFASVSLMLPMKIMNTERRIQAALEAVGEKFSQYAYLREAIEQGKEEWIPGADEFSRTFCENLEGLAGKGYAQGQIEQYIDTKQIAGVTMERSSIEEENGGIELVVDYEIKLPFPVLGIGSLKRTARCRRRAWIGLPGKREGSGGMSDEETEEMVYVGRGSTRFHRDPSCHYLSNQLTGISLEEIKSRRNNSGGKYRACSVCGTGKPGSTVYIMPEGSSYHTDVNCRAIVAYVQKVKRKTVEHLGACSYCGK